MTKGTVNCINREFKDALTVELQLKKKDLVNNEIFQIL